MGCAFFPISFEKGRGREVRVKCTIEPSDNVQVPLWTKLDCGSCGLYLAFDGDGTHTHDTSRAEASGR